MRYLLSILLVISSTTWANSEFDHNHEVFTGVLEEYVIVYNDGYKSAVDYASLSANSNQLKKYLQALSAVEPKQYRQWHRDEQLAFLINAYNAFTLELIIDNFERFESGKATSIRDLGSFFRSPWKLDFFQLLGEARTLDWLEHEKIRVDFDEPRIHAALVCAAVSCPKLRSEAFIGGRLDAQLEEQMMSFLSDRDNSGIANGRLYLSKIFDWYENDFGDITAYMQRYAHVLADNDDERQQLENDIRVRYVPYNWQLNSLENR